MTLKSCLRVQLVIQSHIFCSHSTDLLCQSVCLCVYHGKITFGQKNIYKIDIRHFAVGIFLTELVNTSAPVDKEFSYRLVRPSYRVIVDLSGQQMNYTIHKGNTYAFSLFSD